MNSQLKGISIAVAAAVAVYFVSLPFLADAHARLFAVIILLVVLWTNEALPLGVVSLLPIVIFPALGLLNTAQTSSNYANGIIFLFLGGFLLSLAVEKTELHKVIARRLLRVFPATPIGAICALGATAGALSSVLSNTTTALLLMPLAHFLASDMRLKMRLALSIAFGASIGGLITPIGTPPNLIFMGFLQANSLNAPSFVKWIAVMSPLVFSMLIANSLMLSIGVGKMKLAYSLSDYAPMSKEQKKLGAIILALAALLFFNSPIEPYYPGLGLDERSLILCFGLLLFIPGIGLINWEDCRKIPYEIIFLFGAGFALANAFEATGFDRAAALAMQALLGFGTLATMIAIVGAMSLVGLVVSNTAKASISLPIVYSLCQHSSLDSELFLLVATATASFSFILPISTPPNAIALSSGAVKVKDMAIYGTIITFVGGFLTIFVAMLIWQFLL